VSASSEIRVPDIGDFTDVPVIEIHVSAGDEVAIEDPLVTLESDKATMDVPAPQAGTVKQLSVQIGDRVSEGSVLLTLESTDGAAPTESTESPESASQASVEREPAPPPPAPSPDGAGGHDAQVVVIGSGPGGYTAAFRAADLGLKTVLIERYERLGGVCLNVGCIPSKALLHAARVLADAEEMAEHGIKLGKPKIDVDALRDWKQSVVGRLTGGLAGLAKQRKVEVITGVAELTGPNTVTVGERTVTFDNCIIAAGSEAATLPGLPEDERIIDSTGALELPALPKRLLVVGCGIIGLEMATVYDALGSKETLHVELSNGEKHKFDGILVAIGRRPNGNAIGAEAAGVQVDERGFIAVDRQMRTNVAHIYAIGDVVGGPMLAHKASHEGKVAAEVIAGHKVQFDARTIPSVAYTDPEVAWMGLTETEAREQGTDYDKAVFPWAASGRALSLGRDEGMTKLLFDPETHRLLGAGIVGVNAGELIAETVHALELGSDAEDIALTVHPHPTLTETIGFAAEMAEGTITDLMPPRKRARA